MRRQLPTCADQCPEPLVRDLYLPILSHMHYLLKYHHFCKLDHGPLVLPVKLSTRKENIMRKPEPWNRVSPHHISFHTKYTHKIFYHSQATISLTLHVSDNSVCVTYLVQIPSKILPFRGKLSQKFGQHSRVKSSVTIVINDRGVIKHALLHNCIPFNDFVFMGIGLRW